MCLSVPKKSLNPDDPENMLTLGSKGVGFGDAELMAPAPLEV